MISATRLATLALGACATASAATVSLPPGESAASWGSALEIAGLDLVDAGPADVVVDVVGGRWRLRAGSDTVLGGRGTVVDAPDTDAERETVAFLMRALAQELSFGRRPGPRPLAPPPPPPVAAPPVTEPVPSQEMASNAASTTAPPEPSIEAPPLDVPAPELVADGPIAPPTAPPAEAPTEPAPPEAPAPEPAPETPPERSPTPPPVTRRTGPAVDGFLGPGLRTGRFVAAIGAVADVAPAGRVGLDVWLSGTPTHDVSSWGHDDVARRVWTTDILVGPRFAADALRVTPLLGLAAHGFRQQGVAIAAVGTPVVGVGARWSFGRSAAFSLVARATWDVRKVTLLDSVGTPATASPVGATLALAGGFGGGRSDRARDDTPPVGGVAMGARSE
jgi:hypothetical protein